MPDAVPHPAVDLAKLSPGLRAVCEQYLSRARAEFEAFIRGPEGGVYGGERFSRALDGILGSLFGAADAAARDLGIKPRGRVALLAVGGYGRGLLGLHSDIDVLFACDKPREKYVAAITEGVLYPLWDLGITIGHAVRGCQETLQLAREDIRTATTLLDMRRVAGDGALVGELQSGARRQVFDPALDAFLDALMADSESRHEKYGDSLYLLEPEVKLGRGGLRDLDVVLWAIRARWGGATYDDLVRSGALVPREAHALLEVREFLWRVRNLLHLRAGRRQDRLTFEDQEETAIHLGFKDGETLGVEQFMQAYYRHAQIVAHTGDRLIANARPQRRRASPAIQSLDDGTVIFSGCVAFDESHRCESEPIVALRLYANVVKRGLAPHPHSRDTIARLSTDKAWCARLRESEQAGAIFLSLLESVADAPVRRGSILGELHEVGLMLAMIPEFEAVTGRVQHDVYHVYTVDVHSVAAIDRLRALVRGERRAAEPLASRLAAETPRPTPLFLGLLLHDVGKAYGREHAVKGAEMARPIARRLGLADVDVDHVCWLVLEHLHLYHWAMRRDTADPDTIAEVARHVGTAERLRDLYLLTVADVSTTNPNAMTSWKARMLEELYASVVAYFEEHGARGTTVAERADTFRRELRAGWAKSADRPALDEFITAMPDRYLLANTMDTIRRHANAFVSRKPGVATLALTDSPTDGIHELVLFTDDRPGLLSEVAVVLAGHRLSVDTAQIYNRRRKAGPDEAVDVFHVRPTGGELPTAAVARIEQDLRDLLEGRRTVAEFLARVRPGPAWAQKRVPKVPTKVSIDPRASAGFSVVDVYTRDRLGLLHILARTLHEQGLTIGLSKIHTEGARVSDVFYVTDAQGRKIDDAEKQSAVVDAIRRALEQFHAQFDREGEAA